jgi:hypothetical protein
MSGDAAQPAATQALAKNAAPKIDLEQLADKVYRLMLEDARLSTHRQGSTRKMTLGRSNRL